MFRVIYICKNGRNRRNYDLLTGLSTSSSQEDFNSFAAVLDSKRNLPPKKMKEYLITEGYKIITKKLRKAEKERLASCRFVRDIISELNGLEMKYAEGVLFVTLPAGKLFEP